MSEPFKSVEDAIRGAATATREKFGNKHESIAIVYEQDGKFHFTDPSTSKQSSKSVHTVAQIPKGSARAIVHNHPEGKDNHYFSDDDMRTAERLKIPSAIIFGTDPTVRIYTPGASKIEAVSKPGGRNKYRRSLGDEFLMPAAPTAASVPPTPAGQTPPAVTAPTATPPATSAGPQYTPDENSALNALRARFPGMSQPQLVSMLKQLRPGANQK